MIDIYLFLGWVVLVGSTIKSIVYRGSTLEHINIFQAMGMGIFMVLLWPVVLGIEISDDNDIRNNRGNHLP